MKSLVGFLALLSCASSWVHAEVAMVHPQVPETILSLERTRDLLLGRVTTWNDGSPVVLVLVDDPSSDALLMQLIGRDRSRLLRGWKRMIYTGSGAMPLLASSPTEAIDLVARHAGAIALIPNILPDGRCRYLTLGGATGP